MNNSQRFNEAYNRPKLDRRRKIEKIMEIVKEEYGATIALEVGEDLLQMIGDLEVDYTTVSRAAEKYVERVNLKLDPDEAE